MKSNVKVPHEFFKKSKKEYSNWIFAFLRELIQNSVDAKSSHMDFTCKQEGEYIIFTCTDNGTGMDQDTLTDVLLCLGGSKKEADAIGGFGYAKTLLFFAHKEYIIHSKSHKVVGSGGEYEIEESSDYVNGTDITVKIPINDEVNHSPLDVWRFEYDFKNIINKSYLPKITFSFNDVKFQTSKDKFSYKFPTPIGNLLFNDDKDTNYSYLCLRINGLAMFTHIVYTSSNTHFSGVIDLDKKPTEVLTSNRDALKGKSSTEFNSVIESLQNERSSLKSETTMDLVLNQANIIKLHKENNNKVEEQGPKQVNTSLSVEEEKHKKESIPVFSPFRKLQESNKNILTKFEKMQKGIKTDGLPQNFYIKQSDGVDLNLTAIKSILNQSSSQKLAYTWKRIVYTVLQSIQTFHFIAESTGCNARYYGEEGAFYYHSRPIHVGFCFDQNLALNSSSSEKISILLNLEKIKEMKKEKKLTYSKLLDLAFHEVAHIFQDNHNASFCSAEMEVRWMFNDYWKVRDITKVENIKF
jgi:hypothetical protein